MIQSSFLFASITNKMAKLASSIGICFVSSNLYEIHKTVSGGQSIKSNYGDIFSFPEKLKYDDCNIFTKLLLREQDIIIVRPAG